MTLEKYGDILFGIMLTWITLFIIFTTSYGTYKYLSKPKECVPVHITITEKELKTNWKYGIEELPNETK